MMIRNVSNPANFHLQGEKLTFKILALKIAELEGGKQSVNIAQINEILKIVLQILAWAINNDPFETMTFIKRYKA